MSDPWQFCVAFTHIRRNPGQTFGWRWHKWGEYIGSKKP